MAAAADNAPITIPRVLDDRLKLQLFAAEPDIVTPTGIATDAKGRVLAIESNTHFRPKDYDGPPADRIRRFEDTDGDGRADRITTFFEGSVATMSAALYRDDSLYVATRNEIFRLRDTDGDGLADERTSLVKLESEDNYPHNGLAGFAFDPSGDVYFGFGENHALSFKLIGSDGKTFSDVEGGHIYRCRPDGSKLERVAIGFWNPHALAIDSVGRLFAVDNDPDSLPPCRLLHVVPGGDYGYKYRNGRKGTHPFTAWNGEVPGTLPMVAGVGEAPAGVIVCGNTATRFPDKLPADYRGDLLVTSWGDHRIERYQLKSRGASFSAERINVVVGDENFRPVDLVVGGDGAIYFTDWVDKSYNLHKKGRIWRLSTAEPSPPGRGQVATGDSTRRGEGASANSALPPHPDPLPGGEGVAIWRSKTAAEQRAEALRNTYAPLDSKEAAALWTACADSDPFIQQAAREGLKRIAAVSSTIDLKPLNPLRRLAAERILREENSSAAQTRLPDFLSDPDPAVRLVALIWAGEERVAAVRHDLDKAISAGPTTAKLFAAYLAAQEKLDRPPRKDSDEWASDQYCAAALVADSTPPEPRRWAVRTLRPDHPIITSDRMQTWLTSDDEKLRLEAIRTLRDSQLADRQTLLWQIVDDAKLPDSLRCEALVGIQPDTADSTDRLIALVSGNDSSLAIDALRSLRGAQLTDGQREKLLSLKSKSSAVVDLVEKVLHPLVDSQLPEPNDLDRWLTLLEGPADAAAGQRVFFHTRSANCSRCHQVEGRRAQVGPDLTVTGRTLERRRLVESILSPSKEIAPQFVVWSIQLSDGRSLTGMLLGINSDDSERYSDPTGKVFSLRPAAIESRRPMPNSLMPDNLAKQMTLQEFRDLLAFLQRGNINESEDINKEDRKPGKE